MSDIGTLQHRLEPLFPGLLGIRLLVADPGRVEGEVAVRDDLCTIGGIGHGGLMMAFGDTLGAVGVFVSLPEGARTTTIESATRFVGTALHGVRLTGVAELVHRGRNTSVWQTRVSNEHDKLIAVITQTQLLLAG